MLGKLQTYKLQPTKFYEKGHSWQIAQAASFDSLTSRPVAAGDGAIRPSPIDINHPRGQ